jgi:hypothetical protein
VARTLGGLTVTHKKRKGLAARGRGVFTKAPIPARTFLCEYKGQLVESRDAIARLEETYTLTGKGSYMLYFRMRGQNLWYVLIDGRGT